MSAYTTIEIYCDDKTHAGRICTVRRFARTAPGEWVPLSWLVPGAEDDLWNPGGADVPLDVATDADLRQLPPFASFTRRDLFRLPCRKCHRRGRYRGRGAVHVVAVRDHVLGSILESAYDDSGVSPISLADLAAKLRSSAGS